MPRRSRGKLVGPYEAIERATLERELRWLARELRIAWREQVHGAHGEKEQTVGASGSGGRQ